MDIGGESCDCMGTQGEGTVSMGVSSDGLMFGDVSTVWVFCAAFCKKATFGEELATVIFHDVVAITGWGGARHGMSTVLIIHFEGIIDDV